MLPVLETTAVMVSSRYAAALEKSMVSVERLQQYVDLPQEPVCPHERLPIPPVHRMSKERGQITFSK